MSQEVEEFVMNYEKIRKEGFNQQVANIVISNGQKILDRFVEKKHISLVEIYRLIKLGLIQ